MNRIKEKFLELNILFFLTLIFLHRSAWFDSSYLFHETFSPLVKYLVFGLIIYLGLVFFIRKKRLALLPGVFLMLLIFLFNPILVQPIYVYFFLLFLISSFYNASDSLKIVNSLVLVIYMISGLQKINPYFFNEIVPSFFPEISSLFLFVIGIFIILLEVLTPLFLLFRKNKKNLIFFGILNIGILAVAIFDKNIHITVVLWVVFMLFPVLLYQLSSIKNNPFEKKMIILGILSVSFLGYFGVAPSYLSFKIYSGNTNLALIKNSQEQYLIENFFYEKYFMYPPPEKYIYQKIFQEVCLSKQDSIMYIKNKEDWIFKDSGITKYSCS